MHWQIKKSPRWPVVMGRKGEPPLPYDTSEKGWMVERIWTSWLKNLDKQTRIQKRNILLFIDNCAAHKFNGILINIRFEFLPPDTTSQLQSMDQGVIRSLKTKYRGRLAKLLLSISETAEESLYHVMLMVRAAWSDVAMKTIQNAWNKTKILTGPDKKDMENSASAVSDDGHFLRRHGKMIEPIF